MVRNSWAQCTGMHTLHYIVSSMTWNDNNLFIYNDINTGAQVNSYPIIVSQHIRWTTCKYSMVD